MHDAYMSMHRREPSTTCTSATQAAASLLTKSHTDNMLGKYSKCDADMKKGKVKFALFSDHNGSLLRWQPRPMTMSHSPKGVQT